MSSSLTRPVNEAPQKRWRKQDWLLALLLIVATILAYQPAWNGEPVFDDDDHLTPPELRSLTGLKRIWTELGVVSQYYPLAHTAFWIQHKLWGDSMPGYHFTNILLHALAALLLARILQQLAIPGAWLAAAIFALHPVHVESVAWISELKNTLSTVFCLGAALAYLKFDATRRRGFYAAALLLFALGLLSKTVVATLPAALLVAFWWKRGKLPWKQDAVPLAPFFIAGIAMGLLTAWVERKFIGAEGEAFALTLIERCLIAGRATWFYLAKLLWPANLIFIYPRWNVSQAVWWQYLFPFLALVLLAGLWAWRRHSRAPLAALLIFGGTLFPALGFLNVYPFRYSFVADHYQYLASIGPIVLAAAWLGTLRKSEIRNPKSERNPNPDARNKAAKAAKAAAVSASSGSNFGFRASFGFRISNFGFHLLSALLLLTLAALSWRQSRMYAGVETLWRTTIARNPACFVAHSNLGNHLLARGEVDEAIRHCRRAVELEPRFAEIHNNLANALLQKGQVNEAIQHYQKALDLRPGLAAAHFNLGNIALQNGRADEAMARFQKAVELEPEFVKARNNLGTILLDNGQVDDALVHFQKALEIRPDDPDAHNNLGNALLRKGRLDDALAHYRKALAAQPHDVRAEHNLANVLLQKGQVDDAIVHFRKALTLQPDFAPSHSSLGSVLLQKGQVDDAIGHLQRALNAQPRDAKAHNDLGNALLQKGRLNDAIACYQKAIEILPGYELAHYNLGYALLQSDRPDDAIVQFQQALSVQSDFVQARYFLGNALLRKGRLDDAIAHLQMALRIEPNLLEARADLGDALLQKGKAPEALTHYRAALRIQPDNPSVMSIVAWMLSTSPDASIRNGTEAIRLAQRANQLTASRDVMVLRALAAAYAEGGRFSEANRTAQQALAFAASQTNSLLADALRAEINLYQADSPFRERHSAESRSDNP